MPEKRTPAERVLQAMRMTDKVTVHVETTGLGRWAAEMLEDAGANVVRSTTLARRTPEPAAV